MTKKIVTMKTKTMKKTKNPYSYADKQIKRLLQYISAEYNNASLQLPIDELNVMQTQKVVKNLYKRIEKECRRVYKDIIKKARLETEQAIGVPEGKSATDSSVLDGIVAMYCAITAYRFDREFERKRDRLVEAIMSVSSNQAIRGKFSQNLQQLSRQISQFGDICVDESRLHTMEDNGIESVKWVSEHDDKVCDICLERDGEIYTIDAVPDKPHYHCRCYLVPVIAKDEQA